MTIWEALHDKLRMKGLNKTELKFKQIPGIAVDWEEKVGKFKVRIDNIG